MFLDSVVGVSLIWSTVIGFARVARGVGFGFLVGFVPKKKQSRGLGNSNHACDLSLSKDVENPDDNPHHRGK